MILIVKDKKFYCKIEAVLQITHYGIFSTDTVAGYELKM